MIETVVEREKVPEAFLRPCPPRDRRPIINPVIEDLTDRLRYTEGALAKCTSQVEAVVQWNRGLE